jgi:hypothetical protein
MQIARVEYSGCVKCKHDASNDAEAPIYEAMSLRCSADVRSLSVRVCSSSCARA